MQLLGEKGAHVWEASGGVVTAVGGASRHARRASAFSHRYFSGELIALAVRWYVRYRLSYADVTEWLAERGIMVNRSTVYRWVQRFLPLFAQAAHSYRRPIGRKWHVDETYCQ